MAGGKRQKVVRASDERFAVWEAAADICGVSFNSWACDVLDVAAVVSVRGTPSVVKGCSFDSPRGTRCKVCGKVH